IYPSLTGIGQSGGGGAAGTTNRTILNRVWGDATSTGPGTGWVRYDATLGVVPLDPTTEYATSFTTGASSNNVKLAAPVTGIDTATTVNSLIVGAGGGVTGTGTLTLSSGNLMTVGGA